MKNKEVLIVTNYFPPEKGAASNRLFSLVNGLSENEYNVKVVCPLPNYPQGKIFDGYRWKIFLKSKESFGTLYRLWIWPSNSSNKFFRLLSMLSFSLSLSLFFIFSKTPKKIIIQYSPVFVGFTSAFWASLFRKKIILNVSDLWPLAGLEMGLLSKGFYYSLLSKMETFCYRKSHLILGQSKEILTHIEKKGVSATLFLYRNYPDFKPQKPIEKTMDKELKIVYAGLTGVAQGLHKICSSINLPKHISLHIYGAGSEAEQLKSLQKENIFYHGEIKREELHHKIQEFHLGFVPLANRIYGSVPSKVFELSRLGIPLLYMAGGEGENIVMDHQLGWVVPVNDINKLQSFMDVITIESLLQFPKLTVQNNATHYFDFSKQFNQLLEKINVF